MGKVADFKEVVKGLKHKKIGEKTIKLCPRCESSNLEISSGADIYPRLYGITPMKYVCKDCGYVGSLVLEKPLNENKENEA
jgi:C4-type Zn-finger protein